MSFKDANLLKYRFYYYLDLSVYTVRKLYITEMGHL